MRRDGRRSTEPVVNELTRLNRQLKERLANERRINAEKEEELKRKEEERVGLQWIVTQLTGGVGLYVDKGEKELVTFKEKIGNEEKRSVEVEVLTLILQKHGVLEEVWNSVVDYTAPPEEAFLDPGFFAGE